METWVRRTILLGVAALAVWFLVRHGEIFSSLLRVRPRETASLFVLVAAHFLVMSLQFKVLLSIFDIRLSFHEWFGLTVCNTLFSYIVPARGGLWVRAAYLKQRHDFAYSRYGSLLLGANAVVFASSAVVGLFALALRSLLTGQVPVDFYLVLASLLLATVLGAALVGNLASKRLTTRFARVNRFIDGLRLGLLEFRRHPGTLARVVLLNGSVVLVAGLRFWLSLWIITRSEHDFLAALAVQALATFAQLAWMVPGNFGVREGIIGLSHELLQVPFDLALAAAIVDRAAAILFVFLVGGIYSRILLREVASRNSS